MTTDTDPGATGGADDAKQTAWSNEPPTKQQWYWHWNGDEDSAPLPMSVLDSGTSRKCFVSRGQLGITEAIDCDVFGGWWIPMQPPHIPPRWDSAQGREVCDSTRFIHGWKVTCPDCVKQPEIRAAAPPAEEGRDITPINELENAAAFLRCLIDGHASLHVLIADAPELLRRIESAITKATAQQQAAAQGDLRTAIVRAMIDGDAGRATRSETADRILALLPRQERGVAEIEQVARAIYAADTRRYAYTTTWDELRFGGQVTYMDHARDALAAMGDGAGGVGR